MATLPILQALLIADQVYEDKTTHKKVICGVFHSVFIMKGPLQVNEEGVKQEEGGTKSISVDIKDINQYRSAGSPFCYISLTEVRGEKTLELRLVNLSTYNPLFKAEITVKREDPVETLELVIPLPKLSIPDVGVYAFELICDDTLLGSHRITAKLSPSS